MKKYNNNGDTAVRLKLKDYSDTVGVATSLESNIASY